MDSVDAVVLEGTKDASNPFFSPDGEWIGFFAGGKLKKISVKGGTPLTLCDAGSNRGGAWGPDGMIVFAPGLSTGLLRVPAAGGATEVLTTRDESKGERTHRWPEFLPGGRAILYTAGKVASPSNYDDAQILLLDLRTGRRSVVIEGANQARYSSTGHLLYARAGNLFAF